MTRLPNGVEEIIAYLAQWAKGYDNHLKWNELAQFKADLMNRRDRWLVIDPADFRARCLEQGMRIEDVDELVDCLERRQAGRTLRPQRSYRNHVFSYPVTVVPEATVVSYTNPRW